MEFTRDFAQILADILAKMQSDLVTAAKTCQSAVCETEEGFRKELYELLAVVYRLAFAFHEDRAAWEHFLQEEFWTKCKQKKPGVRDSQNQKILWISRYVFRAADTQSARYNRAYKHARTLQRYLRKKVPQDAIADKLAKEGADYTFQVEIEEHPRRAKSDTSGGPGKSVSKVSGSRTGRVQSSRKSDSDASSPRKRYSESGDPILEVEMTEVRLDRVLGLSVGGKARILVERMESDRDDWIRIVASAVKSI